MFDLGDSYNLSGMHIWNFSQNLDRGHRQRDGPSGSERWQAAQAFTAVSGPNGDGSYTVAESTGASDTGNTYSLGCQRRPLRGVHHQLQLGRTGRQLYRAQSNAFPGSPIYNTRAFALMLLGCGLLGLLAYAWRKRK